MCRVIEPNVSFKGTPAIQAMVRVTSAWLSPLWAGRGTRRSFCDSTASCGKPIVSNNLPTGVRVVNQHEVSGLVVRPGDPAALATALNRLLADSGVARVGEAGRCRAERELDADH
jgi:glycosyltransferase involved in cell wall biosynthesis